MKVQQLIELLGDFDPEMEVRFAYDYGDRQHTKVASRINDVEVEAVRYSDYHSMYKVVDGDDDEENVKQVVVLS